MRLVLGYDSSVWDTPSLLLQDELENVQKRQLDKYIYETGSWKTNMEISQKRRRDSRLIMPYIGLKGATSTLTDDLVPQSRCQEALLVGISDPILPIPTFARAVSFPIQLEIEILFQILPFLLLKLQNIMLLTLLLLWGLGKLTFLITGPDEWMSFRRITCKQFWFWFWFWFLVNFCDLRVGATVSFLLFSVKCESSGKGMIVWSDNCSNFRHQT